MANADIAYRFRTEVERVLDAKYPTALTTLHKILEEHEQSAKLIDDFAAANPCKLKGLIDAIRDQIELHSSVVDFVLSLSSSQLFSRVLIERYPDVAAALITQAEEDHQAYAQLGVNIIKSWHSSPPSLPINADRFLARLVRSITDGTSTIGLLDMHDCLSASAEVLSSALPTKNVDSFLDYLSTLIKQRIPNKEHERIVGIASLYHFWRQQSKATILRKGWEEIAAQLFRPEKVLQAVNLVIVDVFLVTKPGSSLSENEIERTLGIAQTFLSDVDPHELRAWCHLKDSCRWLEKLCAFSSAAHLSSSACWKLASLLSSVLSLDSSLGGKDLVLNPLLDGLLDIDSSIGVTVEQCQGVFQMFGKQTAQESMTRLMQRTVDLLNSSSTSHGLWSNTRASALGLMLNGLRLASTDDAFLRNQIVQWLAQAPREQVLAALKPSSDNMTCAAGTSCAVTAASSKNHLRVKLYQLLVEVLTMHNHLTSRLDPLFALNIVRSAQSTPNNTSTPCAAWQVDRAQPIMLASNIVPCTPTNKHNGQAWREQIRSLVEGDSRHRQESMIHLVQTICHDLEDRCEHTEAPLQQERVRRGQAEKALTELRAAYSTMQSTLDDRDLALAGAETQLCELQEKLAAQLVEATALRERLEKSETAMAQKSADHEEEVKQLRATTVNVESSVRKHLSDAQDELALCKQELQKEQGNADKLRLELDIKAPKLRQAHEDALAREQRLACLETQLVKSKAAVSELQENVQAIYATHQESERKAAEVEALYRDTGVQLDALKRELEAERREHKMKLDSLALEQEGEAQTHQIRHESMIQDHANAIQQLKLRYEKNHEHFESRSREAQRKLEQKIDGLHARIGAQDDELTNGREAISHLEQEIEELHGSLGEKDAKLEALQTLQANWQQVLEAKPAAATRTKSLVRKRFEKPSTFKAPHIQTPAPEPAEQSFDDTNSIVCTIPHALGQDTSYVSPTQPGSAHSSFGSVPKAKRQRQETPVRQPAFKMPMLRQMGQTAASTITVGSPSKRVPLRDVSKVRGNGLSPLRPESTRRQSLRSSKKLKESMVKSKAVDDDAFQEMISEDFGSEVFTGTQMSQSKLHALTAEQYNDGTTVDE